LEEVSRALTLTLGLALGTLVFIHIDIFNLVGVLVGAVDGACVVELHMPHVEGQLMRAAAIKQLSLSK
jgi:hypothetical protein